MIVARRRQWGYVTAIEGIVKTMTFMVTTWHEQPLTFHSHREVNNKIPVGKKLSKRFSEFMPQT
jgi:hypothetical protein